VLRRSSPSGTVAGRQKLRFGRLEIDLAAHEVAREGTRIDMTAREFDVLRVLVEHPRQVFSRDHLFELIWGRSATAAPCPSTFAACARRSSRIPRSPATSSPVWGAGYRFDGGLT